MMSGVSNTQRVRTLIQSVRDAHGYSYDEISKRTGRKLSKSVVHKIGTDMTRDDLLPTDQIRALAAGLGVPFHELLNAALNDLGFLADEHQVDPPAAIRQDGRLLPEARKHLLAQYELLRRLGPDPTEEQVDADLDLMLEQEVEAIKKPQVRAKRGG